MLRFATFQTRTNTYRSERDNMLLDTASSLLGYGPSLVKLHHVCAIPSPNVASPPTKDAIVSNTFAIAQSTSAKIRGMQRPVANDAGSNTDPCETSDYAQSVTRPHQRLFKRATNNGAFEPFHSCRRTMATGAHDTSSSRNAAKWSAAPKPVPCRRASKAR